jgi:hypothetical protein
VWTLEPGGKEVPAKDRWPAFQLMACYCTKLYRLVKFSEQRMNLTIPVCWETTVLIGT